MVSNRENVSTLQKLARFPFVQHMIDIPPKSLKLGTEQTRQVFYSLAQPILHLQALLNGHFKISNLRTCEINDYSVLVRSRVLGASLFLAGRM